MLRDVTARESRMLGYLFDEPFLMAGHPPTCNGGNNDTSTHHDHKVLMKIETLMTSTLTTVRLVCPECGRVQQFSFAPPT